LLQLGSGQSVREKLERLSRDMFRIDAGIAMHAFVDLRQERLPVGPAPVPARMPALEEGPAQERRQGKRQSERVVFARRGAHAASRNSGSVVMFRARRAERTRGRLRLGWCREVHGGTARRRERSGAAGRKPTACAASTKLCRLSSAIGLAGVIRVQARASTSGAMAILIWVAAGLELQPGYPRLNRPDRVELPAGEERELCITA
jgi:hypothetical protein